MLCAGRALLRRFKVNLYQKWKHSKIIPPTACGGYYKEAIQEAYRDYDTPTKRDKPINIDSQGMEAVVLDFQMATQKRRHVVKLISTKLSSISGGCV